MGDILLAIVGAFVVLAPIYVLIVTDPHRWARGTRGRASASERRWLAKWRVEAMQRRLARKRTRETFGTFAASLGPTGAVRDVVRAVYLELRRATIDARGFPVHAEDSLSLVYGVDTPGGMGIGELVERIVAAGGHRITGGLGSHEPPTTVKGLVSVAGVLWQEAEEREREELAAPLLRPADPPVQGDGLLRPVQGAPGSAADDLLRPVERPGGLDEATQRQTGT